MKVLSAVLAVFALIVALGLWSNYGLTVSTAQLLPKVDRTASDIGQNRWDEAYAQILQLETDWNQKTGWWPLVLDHAELDGIRFDLARLREYVANRNVALASAQLAELRQRLEHLPDREAVTVKNIL